MQNSKSKNVEQESQNNDCQMGKAEFEIGM